MLLQIGGDQTWNPSYGEDGEGGRVDQVNWFPVHGINAEALVMIAKEKPCYSVVAKCSSTPGAVWRKNVYFPGLLEGDKEKKTLKFGVTVRLE